VPPDLAGAGQRLGAYAALPALIRQFGLDPAPLLASADLAPAAFDGPENRVPFAALGRLLAEAALRTQCVHFGLLAGRLWRLGDFGLIAELARHSATVADALRTWAVYQHLNSGGALSFVVRQGDFVDFGYAIYYPGVSGADQLCDAALAGGMNIMRELCGASWVPSDVLCSRARPLDTAPYLNTFKVRPQFNAEFSALRFPARWLDRRIEGADPQRLRLAQARADAAGSPSLLHQVFRALRLLLLQGTHSGDAVAQMLSLHRRTLNRRLKVEHTTFQDVLDQVRFDVARQLLSETDMKLDDVAAALGYASLSPFMRAFRRWSGATPERWRHPE
jgi:AraC-like DNA-binding protein